MIYFFYSYSRSKCYEEVAIMLQGCRACWTCCEDATRKLLPWNLAFKTSRPTRHKMGHYGGAVPSQTNVLSIVMRKLNLTRQKQPFSRNTKIL